MSRTIFIDSRDRYSYSTLYPNNIGGGGSSSNSSSIKVTLQNPLNNVDAHVSVLDASIPLSFYQIRSPYSSLTVTENIGIPFTITVSNGNYNASSFATELKTKLDAGSTNSRTYTVTYNPNQNTYTITVSTGTFLFNFSTSSIFYMYLGGNNSNGLGVDTTTSASYTSPNVINLLPWNYIYLKSNVLGGSVVNNTCETGYGGSNNATNPADINIIQKFKLTTSQFGVQTFTKYYTDLLPIKLKSLQTFDLSLTFWNNEAVNLLGNDWDCSLLIQSNAKI